MFIIDIRISTVKKTTKLNFKFIEIVRLIIIIIAIKEVKILAVH